MERDTVREIHPLSSVFSELTNRCSRETMLCTERVRCAWSLSVRVVTVVTLRRFGERWPASRPARGTGMQM